MSLNVLYRDSDLIVIDKPSGLLVHRSAIDRHATEFALQMLRDQIGRHVYPVHRLDRATSGALVFGLSPESARALAEQFAAGDVDKKYLAIVRGVPQKEMTLSYPLKEVLDAKSDTMARRDKPPQPALTSFKTLASYEFPVMVDRYPTSRYSLVQAQPKTGRKHQIRRHLHHLGHPIVGDVTYGSGKHNRFFRETFKIQRLFLACTEVSLKQPRSAEMLRVRAPLAEDFGRVVKELGWEACLGSAT